MSITIESAYGNCTVYPARCTSRKFAKLLGVKTFTTSVIEQLKDLGYTFTVQADVM